MITVSLIQALMLEVDSNIKIELVWRNVEETVIIPVNPSDPLDKEILKNKDICITGYALGKMQDQPGVVDLLRHTWVYARVSPLQKVPPDPKLYLGFNTCNGANADYRNLFSTD